MRKTKEIKERKTETGRDIQTSDLSWCVRCNQLLGNKVISTYPDYCKHTGKNRINRAKKKKRVKKRVLFLHFVQGGSEGDYLGFKCAPDVPPTAQSTIQQHRAVFTPLKLLWDTE